jgi:hypothetical protein
MLAQAVAHLEQVVEDIYQRRAHQNQVKGLARALSLRSRPYAAVFGLSVGVRGRLEELRRVASILAHVEQIAIADPQVMLDASPGGTVKPASCAQGDFWAGSGGVSAVEEVLDSSVKGLEEEFRLLASDLAPMERRAIARSRVVPNALLGEPETPANCAQGCLWASSDGASAAQTVLDFIRERCKQCNSITCNDGNLDVSLLQLFPPTAVVALCEELLDNIEEHRKPSTKAALVLRTSRVPLRRDAGTQEESRASRLTEDVHLVLASKNMPRDGASAGAQGTGYAMIRALLRSVGSNEGDDFVVTGNPNDVGDYGVGGDDGYQHVIARLRRSAYLEQLDLGSECRRCGLLRCVETPSERDEEDVS